MLNKPIVVFDERRPNQPSPPPKLEIQSITKIKLVNINSNIRTSASHFSTPFDAPAPAALPKYI